MPLADAERTRCSSSSTSARSRRVICDEPCVTPSSRVAQSRRLCLSARTRAHSSPCDASGPPRAWRCPRRAAAACRRGPPRRRRCGPAAPRDGSPPARVLSRARDWRSASSATPALRPRRATPGPPPPARLPRPPSPAGPSAPTCASAERCSPSSSLVKLRAPFLARRALGLRRAPTRPRLTPRPGPPGRGPPPARPRRAPAGVMRSRKRASCSEAWCRSFSWPARFSSSACWFFCQPLEHVLGVDHLLLERVVAGEELVVALLGRGHLAPPARRSPASSGARPPPGPSRSPPVACRRRRTSPSSVTERDAGPPSLRVRARGVEVLDDDHVAQEQLAPPAGAPSSHVDLVVALRQHARRASPAPPGARAGQAGTGRKEPRPSAAGPGTRQLDALRRGSRRATCWSRSPSAASTARSKRGGCVSTSATRPKMPWSRGLARRRAASPRARPRSKPS